MRWHKTDKQALTWTWHEILADAYSHIAAALQEVPTSCEVNNIGFGLEFSILAQPATFYKKEGGRRGRTASSSGLEVKGLFCVTHVREGGGGLIEGFVCFF